jgi:competence protein ComEC
MSRYNRRKSGAIPIVLLLIIAGLLIAGCVSWPPHWPPAPGHNVSAAPTIAPSQPAIPGSTANGTLEVHFLDVGQGDSVLVKYGNRSMLVDGGPIDAGPTVASYLKSHGVSTIDVLVSTHPHADHIGGLLTILQEFPVKVIYDSGIPHTTQTYEEYLTLIDRKNIRYIVPQRGDTIDLGPGVTVQVLSPPPGGIADDDLNENSMVLKITFGNTGFLLASDAGIPAEDIMLSSGCNLKSDVLKVGHHGSKYSSGKAFLQAVDPKYAVIEVGAGNPYGHPAPATVARLEEIGAQVYRTDRDGNIVMTSDGRGIIVNAQRVAPA